ncbi:baseplate J/gp47 family protein [Desulfovibrio sp. UCD-KL4C]|uniref:baseplate J/gp47 family protein n=1 Tax=Desulfovibrio sp. UCD-KL4C TaxID=2578120 RepID=UPI0025B9A87D|nr:baseplate J/gp47 family protein [Desulfovibrio sp. UCD-KL4C]
MSIPVKKTLDEIREEIFTRINEVQDEYAAKGWLPNRLNLNKGVVRGLIEVFAFSLFKLYELLAIILENAFPKTATGEWSDLHSDQVELVRKSATKATGTVIFTGEQSGNIKIPAGRILKTAPDGTGAVYRFITKQDAIIPDGQTTINVPVEAEEYGRGPNAAPGQISEISTSVPKVTSVANGSDWLSSEGADTETDAQLGERYVLRWQEKNGCTKYAYASWVMSVPGVIAVTILDQHPRGQGTVDVVVKGAAGVPTEDLLEKVRAAIASQFPINDDWIAKGPEPIHVVIRAELVLVSGSPEAIKATAENRIRALFTDPTTVAGISPLQIGEDLTIDRLISTVGIGGNIKSINWPSPAEDTAVAADGLAVLSELVITTSWAAEA